jgi:hypothetical protein
MTNKISYRFIGLISREAGIFVSELIKSAAFEKLEFFLCVVCA